LIQKLDLEFTIAPRNFNPESLTIESLLNRESVAALYTSVQDQTRLPLMSVEDQVRFQVCCINVVISCVKMCGKESGLCDKLADIVISPLLQGYWKSASILKTAFLQALFTLCYHLKEKVIEIHITDLYKAATDSLFNNDSMVRLSGLKFLGAIVNSKSSFWIKEYPTCRKLLSNLRNRDASSEIRELAEKLLVSFL